MRIFTEEAYRRRIEQVRKESYDKARLEIYREKEEEDFHRSTFNELNELRRRMIGIENLVMPSKKTAEKTTEECDLF